MILDACVSGQQTNYDSKQCCTLYKGGSNNHVTANITYGFWLAGNRVHCAATNPTHTDACT